MCVTQATLGTSFDVALDTITSSSDRTVILFFFSGNVSSLYGNAPPASWIESLIADGIYKHELGRPEEDSAESTAIKNNGDERDESDETAALATHEA